MNTGQASDDHDRDGLNTYACRVPLTQIGLPMNTAASPVSKPDHSSAVANKRRPLAELCKAVDAPASPVVSRLLPGEGGGPVGVAAFQSSI